MRSEWASGSWETRNLKKERKKEDKYTNKGTCRTHISWFNELSGRWLTRAVLRILFSRYATRLTPQHLSTTQVLFLVILEDLSPEFMPFEIDMCSDRPAPLVDQANVTVNASVDRPCPTKKNQNRVPKRIHKAEREKLKRKNLNELFLDLADSLELAQPNNGKATVLNEATRLLKDLFSRIESLKKENTSLLSESHYVTIEKNELNEENSSLESQIEILQSELEARVAHSKPDLNVPPLECQQPELTSHFPGDSYVLPAVEPTMPQVPTVLVVPIRPDLQAFSAPDAAQLLSKTASNVSKPHARYPNPADSWPSQLLGEGISSCREHLPRNV